MKQHLQNIGYRDVRAFSSLFKYLLFFPLVSLRANALSFNAGLCVAHLITFEVNLYQAG